MLLCPTSAQYLVGTPKSIKRREFDGFLTFLGKFLRGRVHVAHFVFEIALSGTITLTLLLVCSFSPRVHSIPRGPHNP